jgi:hypothetical protein
MKSIFSKETHMASEAKTIGSIDQVRQLRKENGYCSTAVNA